MCLFIKANDKESQDKTHPLTSDEARLKLPWNDGGAIRAPEAVAIPTPFRIEEAARSSSHICAMGKRARERLDEERKKRKTIQVLQEDVAAHDATKKLLSSPTKHRRRAPPRPIAPTLELQQPTHHPTENNHIPLSLSNLVRIYIITIPTSSRSRTTQSSISYVTPELLQKFFTGLDDDIERIFAIPLFPFLVEPLDDPKNMQLQLQQGGCWLRTFVQFTSNTAADLAVLRSGESISWRTRTTGDQTHQQHPQQQKVSIIVQPIQKSDFSTTVPQILSIDAIIGQPILTAVERLHACLPTFVSQYLVWFMAASLWNLSPHNKQKKLWDVTSNTEGMNNDPKMNSTLSLVSDYVGSKSKGTDSTIDKNRPQKYYLISLYNALWDCHAELERTCSSLLLVANAFGTTTTTTTSEHPAVRIVQSVSNWLLHELEKKHIQFMQHQFQLS